jgi:hypothetical protein
MSDSDDGRTWNDLRELVKAGGPPPAPQPVDPADLRRCWEFTQKIQAQHPPAAGGSIGIDIRCIEAELPGANVLAVWLRVVPLQIMQMHGALKEWEHGTDLDDVVFQVAATFPFGGNKIHTESFREQLRATVTRIMRRRRQSAT